MKNKLFIAIAGAMLLLAQQPADGQTWITNGSPNNVFVQPDNTGGQPSNYVRSIGIGYFGSNYTNSLLHVDGNNIILPANNSIASKGEVFRTDAPHTSGNNTFWRMYHGGTQRFNINHGYNNDYVSAGTTQNEHLRFFTAGESNPRVTILGDALGIGLAGYVGIGTTSPNYLLHQDGGTGNGTYHQFTNGTTSGTTTNDGLRIGIGTDRTAHFLQHEPLPMIFYTLGATSPATGLYERMRITQGAGYYDPGTSLPSATRVGISYGSSVGSAPITSPQAMLHLGLPTSPDGGWRNWMDVGTYMGSTIPITQDLMYVGLYQKEYGNDAVIAWGNSVCLNQQVPREVAHYLRMMFMTPSNCEDAGSGADGREVLRITPDGNVGLGDFFTLGDDPYRTLDVLGNAGIRTVTENSTLTKVLVYNSAADGLIQYREISDFGGGDVLACTSPPQQNNFLTKWNPASSKTICNSIVYDNGTRVGIGTTLPAGRLHVTNSLISNSFIDANFGIIGQALPNTNNIIMNCGIAGSSPAGRAVFNIGVSGNQTASNNLLNIGVYGRAEGANNAINAGGWFEANYCPSSALNAPTNYGIYASAKGRPLTANLCAPGIAGYFDGVISITTYPFIVSDTLFKDSIQDITNALSTLALIQPKSYTFKREYFPHINLAVGRHTGLLAQQVDSILPEIVTTMTHPDIVDSTGEVLMEQLEYKAVSYIELIPLLISGINELNTSTVKTCDSSLTNRITKWHDMNKTLCNSTIYEDNSGRVGINTTIVDTARLSVDGTGLLIGIAAKGDTVGGYFEGAAGGIFAKGDTLGGYFEGTYGIYAVGDVIGGGFLGSGIGVYGMAEGSHEMQFGVRGESRNALKINAGVGGSAQTPTAWVNAGMLSFAKNGGRANIGAGGIAQTEMDTSINVGIAGWASGSSRENRGGDFEVTDTTGVNYGIIARVNGADTSDYAAFFDGKVFVSGPFIKASDRRLKDNISDIDNALGIIAKLEPKSFSYRTAEYSHVSLPKGTQYGLIAQDVESVLPELVSHVIHPERRSLEGAILSPREYYKGIDYTKLIPFLISAIKEQQAQIDSLTEAFGKLASDVQERLSRCCDVDVGYRQSQPGTPDESVSYMTVELSSLQVVVLDQNVPNPFAESTSISYFIPEDAGKAQVMFFDISGRILKTVDVQKGYGIITVFAPSLSGGTYSYSLVIDGRVVETRKMEKMR